MKPWNLADERKPFHGGEVLAVIEFGKNHESRKVVKTSYDGYDWRLKEKYKHDWFVTHWMELPLMPPLRF